MNAFAPELIKLFSDEADAAIARLRRQMNIALYRVEPNPKSKSMHDRWSREEIPETRSQRRRRIHAENRAGNVSAPSKADPLAGMSAWIPAVGSYRTFGR